MGEAWKVRPLRQVKDVRDGEKVVRRGGRREEEGGLLPLEAVVAVRVRSDGCGVHEALLSCAL